MAETFRTNLVNITEMFTRKIRVKVTAKSIRERLTENPYFPSLYALSNVFDRLHIDNTAVKVEKKDYEVFSEKYPLNGEIKEQEAEIDRIKTWCDKAEISATPTIYINGHRLPEKYSVQELKYIL